MPKPTTIMLNINDENGKKSSIFLYEQLERVMENGVKCIRFTNAYETYEVLIPEPEND